MRLYDADETAESVDPDNAASSGATDLASTVHPVLSLQLLMNQLMRLWHFSSSVISFFKRAYLAIQWG